MSTPRRGARGSGRYWIPDWTVLLILVIATVFVVGSLDMNQNARRFPILAGALCIVLGLMELAGDWLRHREGRTRASAKSDPAELREGLIVATWLFLSVLSIYFLGLIVSAFLSTAVYYRVVDRRGVLLSIVLGIGVAFFLWFAFGYLAGFRLYEGLLPLKDLLTT